MSEQIWGTKLTQDLVQGDLIPDHTTKPYALEISTVEVEGNNVIVTCYTDLYRRYTQQYKIKQNVSVPVAVSGVAHTDKITTFEITEDLQ